MSQCSKQFIYAKCDEVEKELKSNPEYITINTAIQRIGISKELDDLITQKMTLVEEIFLEAGLNIKIT